MACLDGEFYNDTSKKCECNLKSSLISLIKLIKKEKKKNKLYKNLLFFWIDNRRTNLKTIFEKFSLYKKIF